MSMPRWKKTLFFITGLIFLALAYIGIIMPGIPAIPFILLSGWFFFKSSDKLYSWMLRQRILGRILKKYHAGNISTKAKWFVISQFWVSIIVAQIIFNLSLPLIVVINSIGILGSILIYKLIK